MTTREAELKRSWMESFSCVVALYSILKVNSMSLRVKQAVYRADEVASEPIDFIIDVETKVKRAVGQVFYDILLRAVYNENLELLSETLREALGRTFLDYGLTPDGTYRRLYYNVKNDQIRSYLKGANNGRADTDNGPFAVETRGTSSTS